MSSPNKTTVVCDSTSYLPEETLADAGIDPISLYVSVGGELRKEREIGDYGQFFERLRTSEEGATTSQPSVGDFLTAYRGLLEEEGEIVSIHLSANISGTYESALQARQTLIEEGEDGERIHVHDSRTAAGGMGLVMLGAIAAARDGASAEGTIERAEQVRSALQMWFAVDTLEYLRKGGRIGAARAWMGSALQIKPILTLEEEITPVERVRTRRRVFERLTEHARELKEAGNDAWVVQHVQAEENAERLVSECREVFGKDPVFVSEVGPVIGAHVGPGLLGVGGAPSALLR